jgi:AraC-like DNA-binding protein
MSVPKIIIWKDRSVYLGTHHVPLKKYTVTADQLVVCLSGQIDIHVDDGNVFTFRTALLKAGTNVTIDRADTTQAIIAIAYLSPISQDFSALQQSMAIELEGIGFHHKNETAIIETLIAIRDGNLTTENSYELFLQIMEPVDKINFKEKQFDPRIVAVVKRIKESVGENLSIQALAEEVHLSESRLVKLFKQQMGLPITRYRLRYRIFLGILHLCVGKSVTDAALAAGFASTAHFSKYFTSTMGIQPSTSFLKPPFVDITIDQSVLTTIT